jgi:DNA invertase Pin-like site-specific DNA recombinase
MLIGYSRVSTSAQSDNLQIDALEAAGCAKLFKDVGSGANFDRPGLKAALEYLRDGGEDTLVVYSLSRLGRSVRDVLATVEELGARKIGLRSLSEQIDTTTAAGRLALHVIAAIQQAEREVLVERVSDGIRASRARGAVWGRPKVLTPEKYEMAAALMREGSLSVRQIAKQVGVAPATIYRNFPGGKLALKAA